MIGARVIEFISEIVRDGHGDEREIINKLVLEKDGKKYNIERRSLDWEYEECVIEEIV